MISLTKIFHFETAHAIYGYEGACKNIHGHSYELHVTVAGTEPSTEYLRAPGFLLDFKELKAIVRANVVEYFDHKLLLSDKFILLNPACTIQPNLVQWPMEPTAENLLLFIKNVIIKKLPAGIHLQRLKLFETKNSYAEWSM